MPALNVCLQVAKIAEASGVPYLEKLAKVAVTIFELLELLEKNKQNKKGAKELSESIANTIIVVDTPVRMHGERACPYFEDVCGAMAEYLGSIAQDLKDALPKQRDIKGIFNVNEFKHVVQGYKKRVDDLKMDLLIQLMGD